jgi:hypothetical protein
MEPLLFLSRGKIGESDTEKSYYQNRTMAPACSILCILYNSGV